MRLEVLSDTALRQLEPARLMALITHVQRFIDKAVAYQRRLIAVAESQRAARAVGDACVADSLVRNTGMSRGAARRASRQAKIIAAQPEVASALACGNINTDQAEAIARADVGDQTRRELVATAASEGTDATRERAAAAEIAARNETPEQRFMRQHANRFLRFYNNREGMVCLEGALDPDSGARLKAKVSAIANRMWRTDKQQPPSRRRRPEQRDIDALCAATSQPPRPRPTSRASRAERSQGPGFRTPDERQSDGQPDRSVAVTSEPGGQHASRSASRPEGPQRPSSCGTEPSNTKRGHATGGAPQTGAGEASDGTAVDAASDETVGRHLDTGSDERASTHLDTENDETGGRHLDTEDLECADLDDVGWADYDNEGKRVVPVLRVSTSLDALRDGLQRAGITDSGQSLSAATVRRLACDAEIIPTVLNGKGRVIDVGRRTRRVSEALRCVLIARDGGCVWPGCDTPPSRCDAHHVKHWADGGPTNADNLALLCHRHHILLHEGRHRLKRVGDTWVVLKPDGTRLHTPLAASGCDNGSGHLRVDDSTASCRPDRDTSSDLATAANTDRAAATPGPSREPSTELETAGCTDGTAPISHVDPAMRSTNGAAPTPPSQLTLACGGRNELTVRLTPTSLRLNQVRAGPIGYPDRRSTRATARPDKSTVPTPARPTPPATPPDRPASPATPPDRPASRGASGPSLNWLNCQGSAGLGLLDFELYVDAGGDFEALERVHGLLRRLQDVEQPLVDVHLEVLARVLVLEG